VLLAAVCLYDLVFSKLCQQVVPDEFEHLARALQAVREQIARLKLLVRLALLCTPAFCGFSLACSASVMAGIGPAASQLQQHVELTEFCTHSCAGNLLLQYRL
jgi:hypothetical protein